jgi:Family of unknown function (DUF5681)
MRKRKANAQPSYEVGYRRPPEQFRFKKGKSGNPTGKKEKSSPTTADLRALLECALNVEIPHGDCKQNITKAAAGIEQLVSQFAAGDPRARRDLIAVAEKLGVDLAAGQKRGEIVTAALAAEDEAIITDFLRRHGVELQNAATSTDPSSDHKSENAGTSKDKSP